MFEYRLRKFMILSFGCLIIVLLINVFKHVDIIQKTNLLNPIQTTTTSLSKSNRILISTSSEQSIAKISINVTPSEAFVTFSNNKPKYLALLSKVLDAVHLFSTRPVIAYGIDVDLDINATKYPRLIKRRLNQRDCGPSIYFCKIYCIFKSQVDYGIYIEADTLVNWNVDILFDVLHQWPYPLPIAPRHPDAPNNYHKYLTQFQLNFTSRTTPYIHAHILWNYRAYPFLGRAVSLLQQGHFMGANFDETAINILLWQAKANHTLCKIDPYISFLPAYGRSEKTCKKYCHTAYFLIHGAKDPTQMHNLVEELKNYTGLPYIQTPKDGFHYLNETKYTCCYPDSRPSSIHPLICEH